MAAAVSVCCSKRVVREIVKSTAGRAWAKVRLEHEKGEGETRT